MKPDKLAAIRPKIASLDSMPTIPVIIHPLVKMLQTPPEEVNIEKVVELVSCDATIAAQCLRAANSPLFGRRHTETVRSAVLALGQKKIQSIVLACCLNQIVPPGKWVFDPITYWRHSMGCALISLRLAKLIGYPDPEKAYLAGLLHDIGILVNTIACPKDLQRCMDAARERQAPLHLVEQELLGFHLGQTGKLLAEHWRFPEDDLIVIEFHHHFAEAPRQQPLLPLINLSDLLCRVCDLSHGYYEAIAVNLAEEPAWLALVECFPELAKMDMARFTLDIEGAMDEIVVTVNAVFAPKAATHA